VAEEEGRSRALRLSVELLAEYQDRLAAQDTYGVLVVLQALDAGGKDGTIRHVMSGVNPQGVVVHSFKSPFPEEHAHDFLLRASASSSQRRLPASRLIRSRDVDDPPALAPAPLRPRRRALNRGPEQ
jgi:polyphosphate kinase 2 (PPK2 family)